MCGVMGNFGCIERDDFLVHFKKVSHLLSRRGPDQTNIIDMDYFMAAHSRLIIQGSLDDGVQPMRYKNIAMLFKATVSIISNITLLKCHTICLQYY